MLVVNFGVIKDFKITDKYAVLKSAIARAKLSFSSDIRKLKSYSIYSSDIDIAHGIGAKLKAIWTTFKINDEKSLVLLDVVRGKYENSKYLSQKMILEQFFQGGKRITEKITSAHFENSVYKLGHEIDEPLYFFHRKVVRLSCHQEDILHKELLPGFYILSGIAGSGKTSLAYLKLKELYKTGGNYLFTTGNRNLAEYLERLFREDEGYGNVEFFGYRDLVDTYFQKTRSLEKVGFTEFSNYTQGKPENAGVDHRMLYSLMQYIACKPDVLPGKRDFFKQISEQQFKNCVKLYGRYVRYLEREEMIDLSLSVLEPDGDKIFDYIIVDESQDLSPREIENINLLKNGNTGVIIFNVDSNQHSNISLPVKYLKSHEYTNEFINVLDASFRIPKIISCYAQAIVDARSFVMQGVPDKDMIREFTSSNENRGNIVHISFVDARQLTDTVSIAVIAFDGRGKEELEVLLPHITQIFTADEIKGLEYDTIIIFDPYDKFSDIFARHHEIVWDKSQVKTNLPKDINTIDHAIKILFNQFFTSVTRSKNSLYILERNPESISNYCFKFKEYLTRNIQEGTICQDDRISDEEWLQQINALVINGNVSQAVKAYKKRGFSIHKIIEENLAIISYEISLISVLSNISDLQYIPEIHVGVKLYRDILSHIVFKEIPVHLLSTDFCRIAIESDVNNIKHVPEKYPEIYRYFLVRFGYLLSRTPQQLRNPDVCCIAIEVDFSNNFNDIPHNCRHVVYKTVLQKQFHCSLENFPKDFINQLVAEMAVTLDPKNLAYLDEKFRNGEVYKLVLKHYNNSLENFPMELMDQGLAKVAAGLDIHSLRYLKGEFLNEAVYKEVLYLNRKSLQNIPQEYINASLAEIAVQLMPANLKFFPYKNSLEKFPGSLITQEIAEISVELNAFNLYSIYASNMKLNLDRIYQSALKSYENSLEKFPEKLMKNYLLIEIAIGLNVNNLKFLTPTQKSYKVYKSAMKTYNNTLELFPKELIDIGLAKVAIGLNVFNLRHLQSVRKDLLTEDFYKWILMTYNNSLELFPKELIDIGLAKVAIGINVFNLRHLQTVRKDLLTEDFYKWILMTYNNSLELFPKELIDIGLAKVAIGLNVFNLRHLQSVREDLLTEDFYKWILMTYYRYSFERFPKEFVSYQLAKIAVKVDIENLRYLSIALADDNYSLALQICDNSLARFPDHLINMRLAKLAIGANIHNLKYLSSKFLSEEALRYILRESALEVVIEFM